MRSVFLAVLMTLTAMVSASAQSTTGLFSSYQALRAQMDPLARDRNIGQLMALFIEVPPGEQQNIMAAEIQMRNALPNPLEISELVTVEPFENGYRQEMLAFRDAQQGYLFVRLVLHEREDGSIRVLRVGFNTDIEQILRSF